MRKVDPAKHEQKRREILEAAGRCFVRDGFRGASISDICAEAGISPGHLYHYFASKEAIIGAMTEAGLERAAERFSQMTERTNVVAALAAQFDKIKLRGDAGNQTLVLDMLAEAGRNPAVADILHHHTAALRAMLGDFLRMGQARGQVDGSLDAEIAAVILIGVIDGAKVLKIRDPTADMTKSVAMLRTLITRFLTPPPNGSSRM
ncbi:MAG: TetR/AcrR family transcriptional regulator, repressor for uid operon [Acetobacteraceae bacterium]|jgi:TetR/AcrR family transcriptional repressor of uid operon|nr:TetR/AcrR family transcriptional regulator, repressor for uid operon [Acetobacteraceae bacterium]